MNNLKINYSGSKKEILEAIKLLKELEEIIGDEVDDNYFEPLNGNAADDYLLINVSDVKLLGRVIKLAEKGFKKAKGDCYKEYYRDLIKLVSDRITTIVEASLL